MGAWAGLTVSDDVLRQQAQGRQTDPTTRRLPEQVTSADALTRAKEVLQDRLVAHETLGPIQGQYGTETAFFDALASESKLSGRTTRIVALQLWKSWAQGKVQVAGDLHDEQQRAFEERLTAAIDALAARAGGVLFDDAAQPRTRRAISHSKAASTTWNAGL